MKIKHFDSNHLSELRERLKQINKLLRKNLLLNNTATSCELFAEKNNCGREVNLQYANSIRGTVSENQKLIEEHKEWIEIKFPGFFKRIKFVSEYIMTWDLDFPAVKHGKFSNDDDICRRLHPNWYNLEQRKNDLSRRQLIMIEWYCFFYGTDHLVPLYSEID